MERDVNLLSHTGKSLRDETGISDKPGLQYFKLSDGFGAMSEFINSGADVPDWFKIDFSRLQTAFSEFDSRYELGKQL